MSWDIAHVSRPREATTSATAQTGLRILKSPTTDVRDVRGEIPLFSVELLRD